MSRLSAVLRDRLQDAGVQRNNDGADLDESADTARRAVALASSGDLDRAYALTWTGPDRRTDPPAMTPAPAAAAPPRPPPVRSRCGAKS
ncbi:hypothetical protein [Streptomyces sp. CA-111067]|uniref:hypothetical protein n=1 Tax=Streptomyces sp. CA-111067 TaxID=3240046 RepID=UPI003D9573E6